MDYKPNDRVNVYDDPETELEYYSIADLIEKLADDGNLELWKMSIQDPESIVGAFYDGVRVIKKRDIVANLEEEQELVFTDPADALLRVKIKQLASETLKGILLNDILIIKIGEAPASPTEPALKGTLILAPDGLYYTYEVNTWAYIASVNTF